MQEGVPIEEWPLSTQGREQAVRAAEELAKIGITKIYSSEEGKAQETARIVGELLGLEPQTRPGLHEVKRTLDKILPKEEFFALCLDLLRGETPKSWKSRAEGWLELR